MSEKKQMTVMQEYGLEMPPDVAERFRGRKEHELDGKYPGKEIYSYSSIAANIWDCISTKLDISFFPPPLVIDYRDGKKTPRAYAEDGSLETWVIGAFNFISAQAQTQDNRTLFIPMDYEVRIFHENMLLEIESDWGKHPLEMEILLTISHTIIHEYCHFLNLWWRYVDVRDGNPKEYIDHIMRANSPVDEFVNEELTNQFMAIFWLNQMVNVPELGDVAVGGPYDLWRRRNDITWKLAATYIRKCQIHNQSEIPTAKSPRTNDEELIKLKAMDKELREIDAFHESLTKNNRKYFKPFVLVD